MGPGNREINVLENGPQVGCFHFLSSRIGDDLNLIAKLDLQSSRQVQTELAGHDMGDAAFTGLAVDADHGFVRSTDVSGIDGQVRNLPGRRFCGIVLAGCQTLFDGVLM